MRLQDTNLCSHLELDWFCRILKCHHSTFLNWSKLNMLNTFGHPDDPFSLQYIMISIKFLLIISVHYKTYRSWELGKWTPKMNFLDVKTSSLNWYSANVWRQVTRYWGWKGVKWCWLHFCFGSQVWTTHVEFTWPIRSTLCIKVECYICTQFRDFGKPVFREALSNFANSRRQNEERALNLWNLAKMCERNFVIFH